MRRGNFVNPALPRPGERGACARCARFGLRHFRHCVAALALSTFKPARRAAPPSGLRPANRPSAGAGALVKAVQYAPCRPVCARCVRQRVKIFLQYQKYRSLLATVGSFSNKPLSPKNTHAAKYNETLCNDVVTFLGRQDILAPGSRPWRGSPRLVRRPLLPPAVGVWLIEEHVVPG